MNVNSRSPRKPRLLLVGEGKHDVGQKYWDELGGALAGFLCALLRGPSDVINKIDWPFEIAEIRRYSQIQHIPKGGSQDRPKFYDVVNPSRNVFGATTQKALKIAVELNFDGVAIMLDVEYRDNDDIGKLLRAGKKELSQDDVRTKLILVVATPSRATCAACRRCRFRGRSARPGFRHTGPRRSRCSASTRGHP